MLPDPPHALGLYFMSAILLLMISGAERFVSISYLDGNFNASDLITHIAAKLHL